jgi:hypothetical protein
VIESFVVVGVTWLVLIILGAFAKPAAVVIRTSFVIETTTTAPRLVVTGGAKVLASLPLFARVISLPLVIEVISVSGQCFPP